MVKIRLQDLEFAAKNRPSDYMDNVLSFASKVEDGIVHMEPEKYTELTQKYATKKLPSVAKQAFNFAKSATKHMAGGMAGVSEKTYWGRLEMCRGCDKLQDDRCIECGCFVKIKAKWASESCPLGKWDDLPDPPERDSKRRNPPKRGCGCGKKT